MLGTLKSLPSNRGLEINANICLNGGVIKPTALYEEEACGMISAKSRKMNILQMKCMKSLMEMLQINRVRNEEVRRMA